MLTRYRAATLATPVYRTRLDVWQWAQLAGLLKWQALYDHDTGDDAARSRRSRDAPRLATAADREYPMLMQHNGAEGIDSIAVDTVFQVAHDLAVEGDTSPPAGPRRALGPITPAGRAQVAASSPRCWTMRGFGRAWSGRSGPIG